MGNEPSSGPHTVDEPPQLATQAQAAAAVRYIGVRLSLGAGGKRRTAPEAGAPEAQRRRLVLTPEGAIVTADVVTVNEGEISPTLWAALEEGGGWPRTGADRITLVALTLDYDDEGDRLRDLNFLFDHFRPANQTISRVFSQIMSRISEPAFDFFYARVTPSQTIFQRLLRHWIGNDERMLRLLSSGRFSAGIKRTSVRQYLLGYSEFRPPVTQATTYSGAIWLPSETVSRAMRRYVDEDDFRRLLRNFRVYLARDVRNGQPIDFHEDYVLGWEGQRGMRIPAFQLVYPRRRRRAFAKDYALEIVFGGWTSKIQFTDAIAAQLAEPNLIKYWISSAPPMLITFLDVLSRKKIKLDATVVWNAMTHENLLQPYTYSVLMLLRHLSVIDRPVGFTARGAIEAYTKEDVIENLNVTGRTVVLKYLMAVWRRTAAELMPIVKQNLEFGLAPSNFLLVAWIGRYRRSWQQRPGEWSPEPDALRILQLFLILGARVDEAAIEKLPDDASKDGFVREQRAAQEALVETLFQNLGISADDVERWRIAGAAAGSDNNVWLAVSELSLDE